METPPSPSHAAGGASAWPWGIHLRLLVMAGLWGASWPWGRVVAQTMPALVAAALRCAIAAVLLLAWLYGRNRLQSLRGLPCRQWLGLCAGAATGMLGYSACFLHALQTVPSGRASVVISLNPVATLVLAAWLLKERLNATIALGMAMAVGGAVVAITHGQPWQILQGGLGAGEWLLLGCVLSWSTYTLLGRLILGGIDAFTATTATVVLGALMLAAASLWVEGPGAWALALAAPRGSWWCLLALGLLATALAYVWYFDGVKALGAGSAAAYITLVPVFGMGLSGLWLGEGMHASLLAGGLLAVAGMGTMHWGRRVAKGG